MDPIIQSNMPHSALGHIDTHSSNDCLVTPQKMIHPLPTLASSLPSPSPSTSGEAEETLEPVPQTCPLSPETTCQKKRTAEQADLNDEDGGVQKRSRNEVQAMTPKAMTPESQVSSSASMAEETASASPQTPKKARLTTKESVSPGDKKHQSSAQKLSPQGTDKKLKKEKVPKITSDEQSRKRKARQEQEFGDQTKKRRVRQPEEFDEQKGGRARQEEEVKDQQKKRKVRQPEEFDEQRQEEEFKDQPKKRKVRQPEEFDEQKGGRARQEEEVKDQQKKRKVRQPEEFVEQRQEEEFKDQPKKRKVRQLEEFAGQKGGRAGQEEEAKDQQKKRKTRQPEGFDEQKDRRVRQEEELDKQLKKTKIRHEGEPKTVEPKKRVCDGAVSRDTPKKRKTESVADIEKRTRAKLYKRITKETKDAPSSPAARLKRKSSYTDPSTTSETDDNIKLKRNVTTRREKVDRESQQQGPQISPAMAENAPATAESSLHIETTPLYAETEPVYFKRDGVVGLTNLGNTCFANTVIQALCNAPAFRDLLMRTQYSWSAKKDRNTNHIRKDPSNAPVGRNTRRAAHIAKEKDKKPVPVDESLCAELGDLFHVMTYDRTDLKASKPSKRSEMAVVSPREFYDSVMALLGFEPNEQHDAQEFLQLALQRMSKELVLEKMGKFGQLGVIDKEVSGESPVQILFGGQYINKNQCNGCPYSTTDSTMPEDFLCLSLGIPTTPEEQGATGGRKSARSKSAKSAISLESCLEHFVSPELVHSGGSSSKAPFCSTCGPREGITKTLKLSKCSQYLCIQLKRFQWGHRGEYKDATVVKPPTGKLDLGPYLTEESGVKNASYDLHTIIVHAGDSCSSGHYIAYTKKQDGTWWKMNDDKSSIVSTEEVVNSQAYMMFFSRSSANTDCTTTKRAKSTSSR